MLPGYVLPWRFCKRCRCHRLPQSHRCSQTVLFSIATSENMREQHPQRWGSVFTANDDSRRCCFYGPHGRPTEWAWSRPVLWVPLVTSWASFPTVRLSCPAPSMPSTEASLWKEDNKESWCCTKVDLLPSGRRARTIPLPPLAVTRNPALITERMARPLALAITWATRRKANRKPKREQRWYGAELTLTQCRKGYLSWMWKRWFKNTNQVILLL